MFNKVIIINCEADKVNLFLDLLEEAETEMDLGAFNLEVKDEFASAQAETIQKVLGIFNNEKGDTNERDEREKVE